VRHFVKDFLDFPMTPGSKHIALQNSNPGEQRAGNARQVAMTYKPQDLDFLSRAVRERSRGNGWGVDQQCEPRDAY
jgi:hypothetical protein